MSESKCFGRISIAVTPSSSPAIKRHLLGSHPNIVIYTELPLEKPEATPLLLTPSGVPFSPAHPTPLPSISSVKEEGQKIPAVTVYGNLTCKPQLNSKRRTFAGLPELKGDTSVLIWLTRTPPASQHSSSSSRP